MKCPKTKLLSIIHMQNKTKEQEKLKTQAVPLVNVIHMEAEHRRRGAISKNRSKTGSGHVCIQLCILTCFKIILWGNSRLLRANVISGAW